MKMHLLIAILCAVLFTLLFSVAAFADEEDEQVTDNTADVTETLEEPVLLAEPEEEEPVETAVLISANGAQTAGKVLEKVGIFIPGYSYISVANDQKRIDSEVQSSYTPAEATAEINGILGNYSETSYVSFGSEGVHLEDSYMVDSRYDRQKVSTIIRNTGLTERSVINIAAEWKFHNVAYDLNIKKESAEDADIDYVEDPRWYVNAITGLFEVFRWI